MKKLYRNDFILNIAVILVCCIMLGVMIFSGKAAEKTVVISYDGVTEKTVLLEEDAVFVINGVEVTIKDGVARVTHSTCPDGLCMKMKNAQKVGDSIICVPNRVSVRIAGNKNEGEADVVAG